MRLPSTSLVSLAALTVPLGATPSFAQVATVPTPASGQPGAPSVQATTPQPGQAANSSATATTNTAIDGSPVAAATTADDSGASGQFLNDIVVTGSRQGQTKFRSSTSVSDVTAAQITQFTPRSEADVLHLIPGIRVESTAGAGGNSNITVRGLPLASGGSKYVQLQEDGLPNVEFGDIAFGNNDFWQRYDYTVDRLQAVRGGTSSTGASQAPGAVINYVSKTGETAGGRVGVSTGLGYDDKRVDFDYGAPISDTLRFNVGGFYRNGEGPRDLSYTAENGYQVKANVTKTFDNNAGYIRLNFKRLDDRAPTYSAMPFGLRVKGDTITGYYPLDGYDARKDTSFSKNNLTFPVVNADGSVSQGNNKDGISVRSTTAGGELHYDFGKNLAIDNRFAYTWNNGVFSVPFFGSLTNVAALTSGANPYTVTTANGTTYTAASARYANGPNAGQTVAGNAVVNGNPTLRTAMNNMNHWANDFGVTGKFDFGAGKVTARAAYYHYNQTINMDWQWNGSLTPATANDPAMIDLYSAAGVRLTDNGITGYNTGFGAFNRHYDLNYAGNAPYATLNYEDDHIDLDASGRYDFLHASGNFFQTAATKSALDVNGDGALSVAEQNTYLNSGVAQKIDYSVNYFNWSLGANYRFNGNTSVFVRASQGHRANADRIVSDFPGAFTTAGKLTDIGRSVAVNPVTQQELGIKQRGNFGGFSYGAFLTGFRSQATEYNYDLTRPAGQRQIFQRYKTYGAELESQMSYEHFALNANIVYTHSRIAQDLIGNNSGNTPAATPDFMFTISPSFNLPLGAIGFTYLGQTKTYTDSSNLLKQRGQGIFNAFVYVKPVEPLTISLNVANLFNSWDQSGRLDQSTVGDLASTGALYGVAYAGTNRVGFGRTFSLSASYAF